MRSAGVKIDVVSFQPRILACVGVVVFNAVLWLYEALRTDEDSKCMMHANAMQSLFTFRVISMTPAGHAFDCFCMFVQVYCEELNSSDFRMTFLKSFRLKATGFHFRPDFLGSWQRVIRLPRPEQRRKRRKRMTGKRKRKFHAHLTISQLAF